MNGVSKSNQHKNNGVDPTRKVQQKTLIMLVITNKIATVKNCTW